MDLSILQDERLAACWRHQDCSGCLSDHHGCGWCPLSSVCVPAGSLLEPVSNANICPGPHERYELRTKALGCGCSTTTLLSVIVTIFATIAALLLLYGVYALLRTLNPFLGTGRYTGWQIRVEDDGTRVEGHWRRRGPWRDAVRSAVGLRRRSEQWPTERSKLLL